MTDHPTKSMDEIVALCRRRGFIWQSSEVYGGINGFWDYGPLGAQLKKNLKDAWWDDLVRCPPDGPDGHPLAIVPVDCTIIMNPKVWQASGHVGGFNDPMQTCRQCKKLMRADHVPDMLREAPWVAGLGEALGAPGLDAAVRIDREGLERWARKKGKKAAPGLRFVRDPDAGIDLPEELPLAGLIRRLAAAEHGACPHCGGDLTEPRQFNLMFQTHTGAVQDEDSLTYLRPETAQGIFTQFWNVVDTSRVKVPFGIAQQGKAFRNEVTPRNFTFRSREFEQMELEFFCHPDEAREWYAYWRDARYAWWQAIGLAGDNLQLREHDRDELAHYAQEGAGTCDIEYRFPFTAPGFGELEGVAHRSDYDLRQHAAACGKGDKLRYFDQERATHYFPHVIEPSAGADRGTLAVICEAFTPTPDRAGSKYVMKLHPRLAPIKAGIFPLVAKDGMPEKAEPLYRRLRRRFPCQFDVKQAIGKRYARMDEAGTPFCVTIDGDTLQDDTVTVRERDTASQQRIHIDQVEAFLADHIGG